jgi:hypothetical protein
MASLRARPPGRRTPSLVAPQCVGAERGGLAVYLLAWAAPLSFCAGLVALAVLPSFGVAVPRGFILVHGAHCTLLALLALLLRRPWLPLQSPARQHRRHPKDVGAAGGWAATWKGPRASARSRALLKGLATSAALAASFRLSRHRTDPPGAERDATGLRCADRSGAAGRQCPPLRGGDDGGTPLRP